VPLRKTPTCLVVDTMPSITGCWRGRCSAWLRSIRHGCGSCCSCTILRFYPTSPAAKCLEPFAAKIQKKPTPPFLAAPIRPAVQPTPSEVPKRSSSRLANSKLAKILITRRGEVLLMRCFNMEASELDVSSRVACQVETLTRYWTLFPCGSQTLEGLLSV
jgi:hypothetical protein